MDQLLKLNFQNKILPDKGKLLLAEPFLVDNYFTRAVILIVDHNLEGTTGFIINKPIDVTVKTVLKKFPLQNPHLHIGGPVSQDALYYIHTLGSLIPGSTHVIDNLYWGGNYTNIVALLEKDEAYLQQIKFFAGYAGWGAKQLNTELSEKSWIVAHYEESFDVINQNASTMWASLLKRMGGDFSIISNFPLNPIDN